MKFLSPNKVSTCGKSQIRKNGFTLLELSVVILISGIMLIPLVRLYANYVEQQKIDKTVTNLDNIRNNIAARPVRYPCPSDRSIARGDSGYGMEVCDTAVIPLCTTANQGICKVRGSRNTNADSQPDWILIGGVPLSYYRVYTGNNPATPDTTTLESLFGGGDIEDGYHNLLNYAVSEETYNVANLTAAENYKHGVINAIDENDNQTAGVTLPGDAQFVVWSSGEDGSGAYSTNGVPVAACPVGQKDEENCNKNFTFRQGLSNYDAAGSDHFDDKSLFYLQRSGDLWTKVVFNGNPTSHIVNLNTATVNVKTALTSGIYKLYVNGNIKASTLLTDLLVSGGTGGSVGALPGNGNIWSTHYCPGRSVATNWVGSGSIGGPWGPKCADPFLRPGVTGQVDCHALYGNTFWVVGILTDGQVMCSDGTVEHKVTPH